MICRWDDLWATGEVAANDVKRGCFAQPSLTRLQPRRCMSSPCRSIPGTCLSKNGTNVSLDRTVGFARMHRVTAGRLLYEPWSCFGRAACSDALMPAHERTEGSEYGPSWLAQISFVFPRMLLECWRGRSCVAFTGHTSCTSIGGGSRLAIFGMPAHRLATRGWETLASLSIVLTCRQCFCRWMGSRKCQLACMYGVATMAT
ncbi:hypothetical protein IQ07DRAFT_307385 [Pyrenochaeta sp. DS3sAY3a]|nr:hypothetical protein IQ07DRAFT_307385 [Pyrenochaeta sp. DS3sAY3a]